VAEVPVENILAMYDAAREFGLYQAVQGTRFDTRFDVKLTPVPTRG
jgi:hypothetical protein